LFTNTGSNDLFNNNTSLFNQRFNSLTKDFEALYQIRKDGNLTARYSYRLLNNTTLNSLTSSSIDFQYVNGLGLVYTRDFDTFGEFIRNIFRRSRRDRAPVTPNPTPTTTGGTPAIKPDDDEN
jgi:ERCC4-type nuclease